MTITPRNEWPSRYWEPQPDSEDQARIDAEAYDAWVKAGMPGDEEPLPFN